MKLAPLLAQYLYTHKRLDLPGIGSFMLDPTVAIDSDPAKQAKPGIVEGVSFLTNISIKEPGGLVDFISATTGKIRALAAADLDSHLELARQFLNIGKPFLFEGIGSLTKLQTGEFSFSPGSLITEKLHEPSPKEITVAPGTEETDSDYKSIFYFKKVRKSPKKILALLLVLAGIGLAVLGGYIVYKRSNGKNKSSITDEYLTSNTMSLPDTTHQQADTLIPVTSPALSAVNSPVPAPGNYKFVVETANRARALSRFSLLKGFGLDIRLETSDSISFKLFFILPSSVADTSRLLDSLRIIYTPAGKKAYVDN